jgi:large subunit ribosomal protein L24
MGTVAKRLAGLARHRRVVLEHEGWAGGRVRPLDIRSGDTVEIIAGKDRGKRGVVERVQIEKQRIVVRGANLMKRHTKAQAQGNVQGGIIDFNGPIAYGKVQLVCNRCEKRTRISHLVTEEGIRVMVCRKCGERIERVAG